MKSSFSFSFKVFNALFSVSFMLLAFVFSAMVAVLIARDFNDIEWINRYRVEAIYQLQTPAERAKVGDLEASLALTQEAHRVLLAEHKALQAEKARVDMIVMQQKDKIDNSMVIEKDLGEVYDNRVKPNVVAAKDAVVGVYVSAVSYTKDAYHKLVSNE